MKTHDVAELAQTLFEEIGDAAFITDPGALRLVDVNPMAQRLTGLPRRELLRLSLDQLFRSDDDEGLTFLQRALHTTQTFHSQEGYFLRRGLDGSWTPVNLTLTRLHAERGQLGLVLARDVTERVQAEERLRLANATLERRVAERTAELAKVNEALRVKIVERDRDSRALLETQQRLADVIASSPAVIFALAIDQNRIRGISWISDNLREMLGHASADAYREGWWLENVHPEEREALMARTQEDLFGQGYTTHEYRFCHGDGTYRWTRGELRLIRDAAGQPVEAVGSWSNITERKMLEDQVRQSQKMEAVGRLAGGVAHDFNNLLTIINGYGEMMLGDMPAGDPNRDLVREVVSAGERASRLTRQLLAFSRKAIIEPRVLDLNVVVADVERMLRRIVGEDIQLSVAADPEAGAVKADAGQMEQVLLNLVVNARDAMPKGGRITIEVHDIELDESYCRTHPDARPGSYVLLAVADTGCGMDQATIARIFEPFFTTKGELGTGLGLATVHGIVKQSGGHVGVYSEVGRGAAFKIYLPRFDKPDTSTETRLGQSVLPLGSETVLLVEDEEGVRALTAHVLRDCGYTVVEARDGAEALRIAEHHGAGIAMLVTDVVMPRFGGRELAERVRQIQPNIKVLFLSGYTDDAVVRHGVLEAEVAFLQKPFTPSALANKVRDVLDGRV